MNAHEHQIGFHNVHQQYLKPQKVFEHLYLIVSPVTDRFVLVQPSFSPGN